MVKGVGSETGGSGVGVGEGSSGGGVSLGEVGVCVGGGTGKVIDADGVGTGNSTFEGCCTQPVKSAIATSPRVKLTSADLRIISSRNNRV